MRTFITSIMILTLSLLMTAAPAFAADYWKGLKGKVKGASTKKDTSVTTAVGGVRATRNGDPDSLYWKGKEVPLVVDAVELTDFNAALDQAMEGDLDGASDGFKEFIEKYPASPLKPDAMEALKNITLSQVEPVDEQQLPVVNEQQEGQQAETTQQETGTADDAPVSDVPEDTIESEAPVDMPETETVSPETEATEQAE